MSGNLFTIPAGLPFGETLAAELRRRSQGKPEALARMRVLLPTRRACRTLRENFLQLTNGQPLLLPRLQPLGDVEAEEIAFDTSGDADAASIPPAIAPLRRQMLLARLIMARPDFRNGPAHALALGQELGKLIDRVHTENLDLGKLATLAGDRFAAHWQVTLDFLSIVSQHWPAILAAEGAIDAADRRNRLLLAQAAAWEARPPATPIIAAGITGSIPAAARLLAVIAGLPQGALILPGLDLALDDESWDAIDDSHPQSALKQLLARLGASRDSVRPLARDAAAAGRLWLAGEMTRPATTTAAWADLKADHGAARLAPALTGLWRCDADTPQEEAQAIALLLRETLETPGKTAALVTSDRDLARRVAACCRRWGLALDDSAGLPLGATPQGIFLRLIAQAVAAELAPSALLALLRHNFCRLGLPARDRLAAIDALEIGALRGPRPAPGLSGLRRRAAASILPPGLDLLDRIENALSPLLALDNETAPFAARLDAHLQAAENLAAMPDQPGRNILWQGDAGDAGAGFFADLRDQADQLPPLRLDDYLAALEQLMGPITVRPAWGTHPRLSILGLLEARLLQADLVILGGLNEGAWPPDPGYDPWMSRPMMAEFGLPAPEQAVGLAAHDFVQGFAAPSVMLTRARRAGGAPTVPARWLQRLDAVLQAMDVDPATLQADGRLLLSRAAAMDHSADQTPATRPAPRPPLALRPRRLSVTEIETWLSDPYQIYARHILRLRPLQPLEKPPDAAERGQLLHDVMRDFVTATPGLLPPDARRLLLASGRTHIDLRQDAPGFWDFWWPRFERIADWTVEREKTWRVEARPVATEIKGRMEMDGPAGPFTLTARADRIDRLADGSYALIDYKSGGQHSAGRMASGAAPQLPLEALILEAGGFSGLPAGGKIGYLGYWIMTGGDPAGEVKEKRDDLAASLDVTRSGLAELVRLFDDPATPYFSIPDADRAPRYNDYAQLSRLQEWTALGEAGTEEAA